jgi:hypothetical protein
MQKLFNQIAISLSLLFLVFVCGTQFSVRGAEPKPAHVYLSDMTLPNRVQLVLSQRAQEGWRFVAMSNGNQDGQTVMVLVFEKE